MSAPRDKGTAAQQPALLKALENMLKRPENKLCVDCGTTAPRWASTNLGVFMCIRCSGIHRSLGVHISKVKSVSLDKWSPEQVEFMEQMGNEKGNALYEAHVPSTYRKGDIRSENIALEQWIRDKYERKKFMAHSSDGHHKEHRDTRERGSGREREREDYSRERGERDSRERDYRDREPPARETREREYARETREREPVREVREREPVSRPPARTNNVTVKVPAPVTAQPAQPPIPAPGPDLLNWDEPVRAPPAPVVAEPEKEDFFGEFSGAAGGGAGAGGQPQKPDKNAILQLYNKPIAPAAAYNNMPPGVPPQAMYPGPNYNMHPGPNYNMHPGPNYNVHMVGGYAPNPYGMPPNMPPNYNMNMNMNMNMGRGPMGPPGYMGAPPTAAPSAIPPGYFNKPANQGPSPAYGGGAPGYPNYGAPSYGAPSSGLGAANTNHLIAGLGNLRM